jgi:hypothetical protein
MAETDPKFKSQSLVKIIQANQQYPYGISEIRDDDPRIIKSYKRGDDPELSHIYVIQFSAKSRGHGEWVYYIRSITDGSGYFFAEKGLVPHHNLKDILTPDQKIRLKRGWQKNMDGDGYDSSEMAENWSGTVVTITSIIEGDLNGMFACIAEDNGHWKWFPNMFDFFDQFDNFEVKLNYEDLKPGDKLIMRDDIKRETYYGNNCWVDGMAEPGEIIIVKKIIDNHFSIDKMIGTGLDTCSYTLEMTTGILHKSIIYKVGDRVIISQNISAHCFTIGQTVEIARVTDEGYYADDSNGVSWGFYSEEIQGLASDVKTTIPDTAFEPGDKVRIRMDLVDGQMYGEEGNKWRTYYTSNFGKQGTILTFKEYPQEKTWLCTEENRYKFAQGMLEFVERPVKNPANLVRGLAIMHEIADVTFVVNKPQSIHLAAATLLRIKI